MSDSQKWFTGIGIILAGWLVYLLGPVLTPFMIAAILAYLFAPLAARLETKMPPTIAVSLVFAVMLMLFLLLLLIIVPVLQEQVFVLVRRLPDLFTWIQESLLPTLSARLGIDVSTIDLGSVQDTLRENWRSIGNVAGFVFNRITDSGQVIAAWLAWIILIPVVTFYLLRDRKMIRENLRSVLPQQYEQTIVTLFRDCDNVLSEFLRGQLSVMLALSLIYAVGLWIAGIEFALIIGLGAGLISFVPYLGSIVGICVAGIVAFFQYQDVIHLVFVALVFGAGQTIEGMLLSPWLVGERIGLHPLAVIFAVLAGGQLFGFIGVLLALPVAAVCVVLFRFAIAQYQSGNRSS